MALLSAVPPAAAADGSWTRLMCMPRCFWFSNAKSQMSHLILQAGDVLLFFFLAELGDDVEEQEAVVVLGVLGEATKEDEVDVGD